MSHSTRNRWIQFVGTPWFTISVTFLGVVLCLLGLVLLASYFSTVTLNSLQQGDFNAAKNFSQKASPLVSTFNFVTFGLVPDLVVWQEALKLPPLADQLIAETTSILESSLRSDSSGSLENLTAPIKKVSAAVAVIEANLSKTLVLQHTLSPERFTLVTSIKQGLHDLEVVIESVSQGKQTWVVLLQNTDEVRATGGFPGSYALLNFDRGVLTEIVVEDIYDADGQFTGYIAAPPGIREYTSGDRGLRLPDANWWPDFPTSAQTMLQFFALGDKRNIAGVIAINLSTAQSVLQVTGPLWLPDYGIEVNADNVGEVLRAERAEFFPGSTQKKHLLQLTITQLKQKIQELPPDRQRQLLTALMTKISEKELQVFSTQPELQQIFSKHFLTGELNPSSLRDSEQLTACDCEPLVIALVESNVGINKVNKYVARENEVSITADTTTITTTFTNNAAPLSSTELSELVDQPVEAQPRNGNGYLNYYRLLISPEYNLQSIVSGSTPLSQWDESIITTSSGLQLKEIGVVLGIPEKNSTSVKFELQPTKKEIPKGVQVGY